MSLLIRFVGSLKCQQLTRRNARAYVGSVRLFQGRPWNSREAKQPRSKTAVRANRAFVSPDSYITVDEAHSRRGVTVQTNCDVVANPGGPQARGTVRSTFHEPRPCSTPTGTCSAGESRTGKGNAHPKPEGGSSAPRKKHWLDRTERAPRKKLKDALHGLLPEGSAVL